MREHLSEHFFEKQAISPEVSNVKREKRRSDRKPSRIPIRSLKRLRNKSGKVRKLVYARILMYPLVIYIVLLC